MTPEVKTAIKHKHRVYKKYVARGCRDDELDYMKMIRNETTHLIDHAKEFYFEKLGKKLCDPSVGIKSYWMTIKKKQDLRNTTSFCEWSFCDKLSD